MIDNNRLFDLSCAKNRFVYKVERNENISSIADKFHTTKEALIAINGISQEVSVGEFIIVQKIEGEKYIVKPTDNLLSIAHNDKNKVFEIMSKNKIDCVYTGQKIYI